MTTFHRLLSVLVALNALQLAAAFTRNVPIWIRHRTAATNSRLMAHSSEAPNHDKDSLRQRQYDRRSVMESFAVGVMTLGTATSPASATLPYDIGCLLDLPPVPEDSVRIYLCRHGQTDNNRLRKVQGARVDPSINYNGVQQSLRLGSALAKLEDKCPPLIYHSNLIRSKETAEYAARNIVDKAVILNELPTLGEVDFGSLAEGQPVSVARGGMIRTYGAWAAGYVDAKGEGGGESGREVMNRATSALSYLVKEAEANGGSVTAIAHSKVCLCDNSLKSFICTYWL